MTIFNIKLITSNLEIFPAIADIFPRFTCKTSYSTHFNLGKFRAIERVPRGTPCYSTENAEIVYTIFFFFFPRKFVLPYKTLTNFLNQILTLVFLLWFYNFMYQSLMSYFVILLQYLDTCSHQYSSRPSHGQSPAEIALNIKSWC